MPIGSSFASPCEAGAVDGDGTAEVVAAGVRDTPENVLRRHFGYDSFRPNQRSIVDAIVSGRDVLAVMPTGAGKSICYQVPAVVLGGFSLVVSPLISLMKDQVGQLGQVGIPAAFINSSLTPAQQGRVLSRAAQGEFTLLYVAPERLSDSRFVEFCQTHLPSLVAIDEAHCISQWGQDFRPSYTCIDGFLDLLSVRPPVCAFTATATEAVRNDILHLLRLRDPFVVVASFDRPNLHFQVRHPKSKDAALLTICRSHKGSSGIVYCTARKTVEGVCEFLCEQGFSATRYHAGLTPVERRANQDDFVFDRTPIIVATNAFGMGIDKSNVSFVVHYNMPQDVESYYQEAGRAGRDGEPADCVLLYAPKDVRTCEFLIRQSSAEARDVDSETRIRLLDRSLSRLKLMTFYATTQDCLRAYLLRYFGEQAPSFCGACGNCEVNFEQQDVTIEAQKIISCVYRLAERDQTFGKTVIVDILRGSKNQRIVAGGYESLSTYGIMADDSTKRVRFVLDRLIESHILELSSGEYPTVVPTPASAVFLRERRTFSIKVPKEKPDAASASDGSAVRPSKSRRAAAERTEAPPNPTLYAALKELRSDIAIEQGVPAYVVFSNHTLHDMCRLMPSDENELLEVSGVGQVKAERFGREFLDVILRFRGESDGSHQA